MKNYFKFLAFSLLLIGNGFCFAAEGVTSETKPQTHVLQG